MKSDRRSGRRESRPGHGCLSVWYQTNLVRILKKLGRQADVTFGEQVVFDYERSLQWEPHTKDEGYSPTEDEIKAACKTIRDGWDAVRWRHVNPVASVELKEFQTRDLIK